MRKIPQFLLRCSVLAFAPVAVCNAASYYNGNNYQQQSNYNQGYANTNRNMGQGGYNNAGYNNNYNSGYNNSRYNNNYSNGYSNNYNNNNGGGNSYSATSMQYSQRTREVGQMPQSQRQNNTGGQALNVTSDGRKNGFFVGGGITHEMAMWKFDMNASGSSLHYDNLSWNVLDLKGGYVFDAGSTKLVVDAGFRYGMQNGETSMIDDDVTNGGYLSTIWCEDVDENGNCVGYIGDQVGHALSIGTSDGGNMMGFNLGLGMPDLISWGKVRFTPSVGYRYFKYKLETKSNYGLAVDTAACVQVPGSDEIQCNPAVIIHYSDGTEAILWDPVRLGETEYWATGSGGSSGTADGVSTADTYYYKQPGTSHSYEVDWSGPYLALDMDYTINQYNMVNGRVELGLPAYTATGDQPYRFDWAHPKSVEDTGGFGDAFHLGLGASWQTALTDSVMLSVGLTYDYYTLSGGEAKTYLSQEYYSELYNDRLQIWQNAGKTESDMLNSQTGDEVALNIKQLEYECPGWVCTTSSEIESLYKSMGIRVGINATF